ncbi:MAG TPA: lysylphosphatidylglycerol synthase domain-containing protein [Stellaceae bacterium]|nr:lysylphosphatidylglycerol synthase domain-containing protein [Stellaceae bacterium]
MKLALRLLGLGLGVAVVLWLVAHADTAALLGVLMRIGWGFAAIVAARGATILIDCAAWYCLVPQGERPGFAALLPLRWIAEAINTTLPAAQIGGDLVRARLLQRRVAAPARGAASVAVDFALSLFAQILFTLLGLVLLARLSAAAAWWPALFCAALVPLFALLSWELLVRRRLLAAAERAAARLGQRRIALALQALGGALALVATSRAALARSLALHLASFFGHAGELWLTLRLMGTPTGFAEATLLESLSLAARSAAFLIPSGWGAQEASLVALAALTGLPAATGLALGLVKRAREFAVGLPGLAAWAVVERRRRYAEPAEAQRPIAR